MPRVVINVSGGSLGFMRQGTVTLKSTPSQSYSGIVESGRSACSPFGGKRDENFVLHVLDLPIAIESNFAL